MHKSKLLFVWHTNFSDLILAEHFLMRFFLSQAYTWGFDIRNWQRHLNPLTWPEIFRQLALSAGFGPRLKKRSIAWSYLPDNDEVCTSLCLFTFVTINSGMCVYLIKSINLAFAQP